MKRTNRILMGVLALMLTLGGIGCGAPNELGEISSLETTAAQTVSDAVVTQDTAIEELPVEQTPGDIWLVPSEAECPAASRDDAPLVMTVEDVTPTQATLVLRAKDGGEFGVGYGAAYGIERFGEEGWVGVGPDRAFPEAYRVAATAHQEHRETVKLEADGEPLEPGYYRLNKVFLTIVNGEAVNITYYAYFEIGE